MRNSLVLAALVCCLPFMGSGWVLPSPTTNCSSLLLNAVRTLVQHQGTLINSTLVPPDALNISGVTNEIAFCQIFGYVTYGRNETLNFQLWLPDERIYEQRFMAIGQYINHYLLP
jgi:hypothetical protein